MNLIHDLIVEKQDAEKTFTVITKETNSNISTVSLSEAKERLRQYNLIGLETRLQEQHWCNQLSSLLIEHVSLHVEEILAGIASKSDRFTEGVNVEHDVVEKVIKAMISSSNLCLNDYENNHELEKIVRVLRLWYNRLYELDKDDDSYYKQILQMLDTLSWKYKISLHEVLKDEL